MPSAECMQSGSGDNNRGGNGFYRPDYNPLGVLYGGYKINQDGRQPKEILKSRLNYAKCFVILKKRELFYRNLIDLFKLKHW